MNNKQFLLAAFLLIASFVDAASVRDNSKKNKYFLRRDLTEKRASRKQKSKSQKDSNDGGVPTRQPTPTPAPVKTVTSLDDWIKDCRGESNRVDDCVIVGGAASPFNCKMCLKSLSFLVDPVPSSPGVKACANSITCQGCSADEIRPFFGCGLDVDDAFSGEGTTPAPPSALPTSSPTSTATPAPTPVPIPKCKDRKLKYIIKKKGKRKKKNCKWAKKKKSRCNIEWKNELIRDWCPVSCKVCPK